MEHALDVTRLFLHVLAATIWVGGQLTLAALVPALRPLGRDVPGVAARAFRRVAWPAFAVLVLTGIDRAKQLLAAEPKLRPTYILADLRELDAPYPATVVARNGTHSVRSAKVRLDGKDIDDARPFVDCFVEVEGEWLLRAAVELPSPAGPA